MMRLYPLAFALGLAISPLCAELPPAPVARQAPVVDDYFGTKVADPYRWMETPNSPELAAYLKGQNDRTRAILDSIPARAALLQRIRALEETINSTSRVERRGPLWFYEKLTTGSNISKLFVRDGLRGAERLLVDPLDFSKGGQHEAISHWLPSDDGAYVVVAMARGGTENAVLHIFETASDRALPETIDRANWGPIAWRADGRAFYYFRLQRLQPGMPPVAKFKNVRTYLHVLGTDPANDVAVFGPGVTPSVSLDADTAGEAVVDPGSDYALGLARHGVQREMAVYVAPKAQLDSGHADWVRVADPADDVTGATLHGDQLYLLTHHNALRFKVVVVDLRQPDLARARVVVPPGQRVIEQVEAASDGLYVESLEDGLGRISHVDWNGAIAEVPLPVNGTVNALTTRPDQPGFVAQLEGWTNSALWYVYDPASGRLADTQLDPPSPVDYSGVVADELKFPASDGVLVPVSIIHRRGMKLDGTNPTIVYAYGSYGIVSNPSFSPVRLAFFERGGIYAIAHVRGGGEYGEGWHLAGKGPNKLKTVTDFIDCGRWLVAQHYTSPAKMAGRGGSAGGIPMGMAIARSPELFAAVLDEIPVSDQLRIEFTANGPPNIPEFGSVRTPEGFKILYTTSPVHHLHRGVNYPAVMLVTGANDPRVEPWQAAKMAATLQGDTASGKPILLRVDYEGGHGLIGATKAQAAALAADEYAFVLWNEGVPGFQPTL